MAGVDEKTPPQMNLFDKTKYLHLALNEVSSENQRDENPDGKIMLFKIIDFTFYANINYFNYF